ncbi:spindle pole body component 110 [Babesia caballi]|uniref:Spindle pole body component 110 n=1 Tax=Babesia caballi TaxID=5871 RepID=A0AAV4LUD7_BABCB|nr:spindle pole body component 110 [Babesia caballi]
MPVTSHCGLSGSELRSSNASNKKATSTWRLIERSKGAVAARADRQHQLQALGQAVPHPVPGHPTGEGAGNGRELPGEGRQGFHQVVADVAAARELLEVVLLLQQQAGNLPGEVAQKELGELVLRRQAAEGLGEGGVLGRLAEGELGPDGLRQQPQCAQRRVQQPGVLLCVQLPQLLAVGQLSVEGRRLGVAELAHHGAAGRQELGDRLQHECEVLHAQLRQRAERALGVAQQDARVGIAHADDAEAEHRKLARPRRLRREQVPLQQSCRIAAAQLIVALWALNLGFDLDALPPGLQGEPGSELIVLVRAMESRLGCKWREIISEVTGHARSDYAASLREEHQEGLLQGKKAYAIDNGGADITLFVPWRLHLPMESLFRLVAGGPRMTVVTFKMLIDIVGLFPKSQSTRKKDDILEYIVTRVIGHANSLDFEEYLHALFLLAQYRAAVLRVTEQCSFNHLLSTLNGYWGRVSSEERQESGRQVVTRGGSGEQSNRSYLPSTNRPATPEADLVQSVSELSIASRRSAVTPSAASPAAASPPSSSIHSDSLQHAATADSVKEESQERASETDAGVNDAATQDLEPAVVSANSLEIQRSPSGPSQGEQILRLAEERMNETCEMMRNELTTLREKMEEYRVHEGQRQELLHTISVLKADKAALQKQVDADGQSARETQARLEGTVAGLTEELRVARDRVGELEALLQEAEQKLQEEDERRAHGQKVQSMLALQTEYETMLFTAFVSYRDNELVEGEFVMSEANCVSFCLDFGLDEHHLSAGSDREPVAKTAYGKVCGRGPEGRLTYPLFKEFLLRVAELVDPQSTQKRAFQLLVVNTIFSRMEEDQRAPHQGGRHLIAPDEFGRMPYDLLPQGHGDAAAGPGRLYGAACPEGYIDVEGKMWFEREHERSRPAEADGSGTPRFPEL